MMQDRMKTGAWSGPDGALLGVSAAFVALELWAVVRGPLVPAAALLYLLGIFLGSLGYPIARAAAEFTRTVVIGLCVAILFAVLVDIEFNFVHSKPIETALIELQRWLQEIRKFVASSARNWWELAGLVAIVVIALVLKRPQIIERAVRLNNRLARIAVILASAAIFTLLGAHARNEEKFDGPQLVRSTFQFAAQPESDSLATDPVPPPSYSPLLGPVPRVVPPAVRTLTVRTVDATLKSDRKSRDQAARTANVPRPTPAELRHRKDSIWKAIRRFSPGEQKSMVEMLRAMASFARATDEPPNERTTGIKDAPPLTGESLGRPTFSPQPSSPPLDGLGLAKLSPRQAALVKAAKHARRGLISIFFQSVTGNVLGDAPLEFCADVLDGFVDEYAKTATPEQLRRLPETLRTVFRTARRRAAQAALAAHLRMALVPDGRPATLTSEVFQVEQVEKPQRPIVEWDLFQTKRDGSLPIRNAQVQGYFDNTRIKEFFRTAKLLPEHYLDTTALPNPERQLAPDALNLFNTPSDETVKMMEWSFTQTGSDLPHRPLAPLTGGGSKPFGFLAWFERALIR